jgi:hypothetical protein
LELWAEIDLACAYRVDREAFKGTPLKRVAVLAGTELDESLFAGCMTEELCVATVASVSAEAFQTCEVEKLVVDEPSTTLLDGRALPNAQFLFGRDGVLPLYGGSGRVQTVLLSSNEWPAITMDARVVCLSDFCEFMFPRDWCQRIVELDLVKTAVVSIPDHSFQGYQHLLKVAFPETLISIGDGAFFGCWRLRHVDVSRCRQLRTIGQFAFKLTVHLQRLSLAGPGVGIGPQAFAGTGIRLLEFEPGREMFCDLGYAAYCSQFRCHLNTTAKSI